MAMERTERKSFLDRLQQSVQIGTQVAGVVQQGQEIQQRGRQLDVMKMQTEELAKKWKVESELVGQQVALNRQKIEQQTYGSLMKGIAFISDSFANITDPKAQDEALEAALAVQGEHLFKIAQTAPSITEARDPATFKQWIKTTAKKLGPVASSMMRTSSQLNQLVLGPDQAFDATKAASSFAQLEQLGRQYMAFQPSSAEVIQNELATMKKMIDDKNARVGKAESAAELLAQRDFYKSKAAQSEYFKSADNQFLKETDKLEKGMKKAEERLANFGRIESLLDKVGTGPIQGRDFLMELQKIANVDAQKLGAWLAEDLSTVVSSYVAETGAKSADSNAELDTLRKRALQPNLSPEAIRDIIAEYSRIIQYSKFVQQSRRNYASALRSGNHPGYVWETPSMADFMASQEPAADGSPIQGMQPAASQQPQAPAGRSPLDQFKVEVP